MLNNDDDDDDVVVVLWLGRQRDPAANCNHRILLHATHHRRRPPRLRTSLVNTGSRLRRPAVLLPLVACVLFRHDRVTRQIIVIDSKTFDCLFGFRSNDAVSASKMRCK